MAKLRHIALSVADLETAQKFFEDAFDMKTVGRAASGVYMSDGTVNIALLARDGQPLGYEGDEPFYGIDHFGMWVDDIDEACRKVEAAGGTHVMGEPTNNPNTFYEVKYRDPLGQIFDLTQNGWKGAVKEVVPADQPGPGETAGTAQAAE